MQLSRRDAIAALAAIGVGGAGLYYWEDSGGIGGGSDGPVGTLVALAKVVYPSDVSGRKEFVRTYATARIEDDEDYEQAITDAADALNGYAREHNDSNFGGLSREEGDDLLREIGIDAARPDPDGSDLERIRYYLVNELIYALVTSPKGGELAGIENPPGHPGGLQSYQQGPQA